MCATVCPRGALSFGTAEEVRQLRPRSRPANRFQFGDEGVSTRVQVLLPRSARAQHLDVLAAMDAPEEGEPDAMLAALYGEEGEA
jgi:hypothetical protein